MLGIMSRTAARIASTALALPLTAIPAEHGAADVTGVTVSNTAMLLIVVALGLFLTLVLKPTLLAAWRGVSRSVAERRLRKALACAGNDVLHDVILPGAFGGLARIDHVVLVPDGVLCVLHKNYRGAVFGAAEDPQWSRVDGSRRQRFLNPVIQNEGRVQALQKAVPGLPVASVVVFSDAAEFATARPENVIHVAEFARWLAEVSFEPGNIDDWDTAWLRVKAAALTDDESRKDLDAQLSFG
jgi:hypothetical protein